MAATVGKNTVYPTANHSKNNSKYIYWKC